MMQSRKFINREKELKKLNSLYQKHGFTLVLITGRRRIGKSRLILEFMRDKKGVRVQFEKRKPVMNIKKMNRVVARYLDIPTPNFNTFTDIFEFLKRQFSDERVVVALDEFSYLIKYSDITAEFQTIVDEILPDKNMFLILSGSAVSMLKRRFFEYSSPLYGRCQATLFLQPLKFKHLLDWFPKSSMEDVIKIYATVGGIPRYLEFFSGKNVDVEILNNFFDPSNFLFREAKEVFEEEFDDPETYYSITEAISHGNTHVTEIANYCFIEARNIAKYLKILMDLNIVQKEFPIFSKKKKGGAYKIKDRYFNFWFRFVSKYFEDIETGFNREAINEFRKNFNAYLGKAFEEIAKEFIIELDDKGALPFEIKRIGRWWHRDKEIDLVITSDHKIILTEVKWKEIKRKEAEIILENLKQKGKQFEEPKVYCLIARKIVDKEKISNKDYLLFDLRDFETYLKKSR